MGRFLAVKALSLVSVTSATPPPAITFSLKNCSLTVSVSGITLRWVLS